MSQTGPPVDLTHEPANDGTPASAGPPAKGEIMGKEARTALLLAGTSCLLAVMIDWVVEELQ
jgi:hypothetical protein